MLWYFAVSVKGELKLELLVVWFNKLTVFQYITLFISVDIIRT